MQESYSSHTVAWKVFRYSPRVASVRYRCILPMLALADSGWRSIVFEEGEALLETSLSALIFVKSFSKSDLALARRLHARGVPIILDLCDNIFVEGYAVDALVKPWNVR